MLAIFILLIPLIIILTISYGIYFFSLKKVGKEINFRKEEQMAKRFILGLGITIILPMLVHYGITTFVKMPKWENYQVQNYYELHQRASIEEQRHLEAERNKKDKEYRQAQRQWAKIAFFVEVPVGVGALIIGTVSNVPGFSGGLMLGGIVTAIMGYCWEWAGLPDWFKFLTLLMVFIVMFWMGYKKLGKKKEII